MEKICVIHFVRDTGGVAKMVMELANEQARNGLNVVIFHTALTDNFIKMLSPEIDVKKIERPRHIPPMLFGLGVAKIYKRIQELHPDYSSIVHVHNIAAIGLLSKTPNVPIVCTIHGISWFGNITFRQRISRLLTAKRLKFLQKKSGVQLVAVSDATAKYYNDLCRANIVCSIHNGIYKDIEREPQKLFTLGFIGDISDSKGWDVSLEAISLLDQKIRDSISFVAAGRALGYSAQEIEKQIDNLKMDRRAEYLGLVTDAYHSVMPKVDLLLFPSISEGLPMSIIEAQSLGIPVIATAVGGIPEIVKDGENGIIVERDPKSVSSAIERLYDNTDKYDRMSYNAKNVFGRSFASKCMYTQYLELYETLL